MLSFTAQSEWWYWLWLRSECQVNRSIRLNQYETFSSFIKSTFHYYYFFFFLRSWNFQLKWIYCENKRMRFVIYFWSNRTTLRLRLYDSETKWVLCQLSSIVCWCNKCAVCSSLPKMLSDMGPVPFYALGASCRMQCLMKLCNRNTCRIYSFISSGVVLWN